MISRYYAQPAKTEKTSFNRENIDLCGAPVGIRTPNLLIRSQMLYPLSYGRLFCLELGQSNASAPLPNNRDRFVPNLCPIDLGLLDDEGFGVFRSQGPVLG